MVKITDEGQSVSLRGYNTKQKIASLVKRAAQTNSVVGSFSRLHNAKKFMNKLYILGYQYVETPRSYGPTIENPRGIRKAYVVKAWR